MDASDYDGFDGPADGKEPELSADEMLARHALITLADFCQIAKVHLSTPQKKVRERTIPPILNDGARAVMRSGDAREWLDHLTERAGPDPERSVNADAVAFRHIVRLMMREARFRAMPLGELERAVIPALAVRQFSLATASAVPRTSNGDIGNAPLKSQPAPDAQSTSGGAKEVRPVAAVLWAQVSDEVDQWLSDMSQKAIQLEPQDWTSGDIAWIVDAMGDRRVIPALIKQLREQQSKGRKVKMRIRGGGAVGVRVLG